MNEKSGVTNDLLNEYVAVNRSQRTKIELLNKELCEKNKLIEKLIEENRDLKEKCEGTNTITNKIKNLFRS